MNKQNYTKPELKFVTLRNQESVAEKCWGNHGTGYEYYDTMGKGYVGFTIAEGSCTTEGGQLEVYYYPEKDTPKDQGTPIYAGHPKYAKQYEEFYKKLTEASGGSYGQPFKGEKDFPDDPGGMS